MTTIPKSVHAMAAALGRRGGRSRSPEKRAAIVANLERARAARAEKRAREAAQTESVQD